METKKLAGGILSVSVKACITVLTIVLLYLAGRKAFDFGTAVFDEKSMDAKGSGYDVMVTIPSGATNNDVANILLNNGLIDNKGLFLVQLKLSDYSGKIIPGSYVLSTTMKPTEMMTILGTEKKETESSNE